MEDMFATDAEKRQWNADQQVKDHTTGTSRSEFILCLIWGHRLNQAVHQNNLWEEAQFTLPGKTCTSVI